MLQIRERYHCPEGFFYTKDHTWAKLEGKLVRVGITDYAQKTLNEVVFVEIANPGLKITAGSPFGTIESAKAVSDLIAPVSGEIMILNEGLSSSPDLVNKDPYEKGWIIIMKPDDPLAAINGLMDAKEYSEYIRHLQ